MRNHMSFVLAAVIALFNVVGQPALGAGPNREPVPSDSISFGPMEVCDFPVLIEAARNKATIKTFANGRLIISGSYFARVTNTEAGGRSITFNNSGPLTVTPNADGSVDLMVRGQSLLYFFEGDVGGRRLLRMTGLVRETLGATGITAFSHTGGTTENLCDTMR